MLVDSEDIDSLYIFQIKAMLYDAVDFGLTRLYNIARIKERYLRKCLSMNKN